MGNPSKPVRGYAAKAFRNHTALAWGLLALVLGMATLAIAGIVQPAAALTLAVAGTAIILLVSRVGNGVQLTWRVTLSKRRAGARDETSELSWMLFSRDNAISFGGNRYIRQVAQRAVAAAGLNLENPSDEEACRKLLGTPVYTAVTSSKPDLTIADLEQILSTLENILQRLAPAAIDPASAPLSPPTESAPSQRTTHA